MPAQGSGHKEEVYRSMYFTKFNILIWDLNLGCNLYGLKENDVSNEKGKRSCYKEASAFCLPPLDSAVRLESQKYVEKY